MGQPGHYSYYYHFTKLSQWSTWSLCYDRYRLRQVVDVFIRLCCLYSNNVIWALSLRKCQDHVSDPTRTSGSLEARTYASTSPAVEQAKGQQYYGPLRLPYLNLKARSAKGKACETGSGFLTGPDRADWMLVWELSHRGWEHSFSLLPSTIFSRALARYIHVSILQLGCSSPWGSRHSRNWWWSRLRWRILFVEWVLWSMSGVLSPGVAERQNLMCV